MVKRGSRFHTHTIKSPRLKRHMERFGRAGKTATAKCSVNQPSIAAKKSCYRREWKKAFKTGR